MDYTHKINTLKNELGYSIIIPAHHYVSDDIIAVADIVGDSYKLAVECSKSEAENIVFCGVKFMAEAAQALSHGGQRIFSPNKHAGCSLADMITKAQMETMFTKLQHHIKGQIIPVVYVNSNIEVKSFCGDHNGATCTSSNAGMIMDHYLKQGFVVFFAPDFNLGNNTAAKLGLQDDEVLRIPRTGNPEFPTKTDNIKLVLWDGFCSVHKIFNVDDVTNMRDTHPGIKIIVHPESNRAVVEASDMSGSTQMIYDLIKNAPDGSTWAIGTECHFVHRMNNVFHNQTIYPLVESSCNDMQKITEKNLYEVLRTLHENNEKVLADYEVTLPEMVIESAKKSLQKMISITEGIDEKNI